MFQDRSLRCFKKEVGKLFSVKGQIVNILEFAGPKLSATILNSITAK